MSNIVEVEKAIERMSPEELRAFRAWFAERDSAHWDERFKRDAEEGKLAGWADEAMKDLLEGRCTEL